MLRESKHHIQSPERLTFNKDLGAELSTQVHIVRYCRTEITPKVIVFDRPTRLLDWCEEQNLTEAVAGGFFCRANNVPLGDIWTTGTKHPSIPVTPPWESIRGAIHINSLGGVAIGPRNQLPRVPAGDLLQAGPVLIHNGANQIADGVDREGISAASHQFDSDISIGRYPRSAVGVCRDYLWSVVCDGRSPENAGMTLSELANFMLDLGVRDALNLDGGGSASQVSNGILQNTSIGEGMIYERGRELVTAISFTENS